MPDIDLRVEIDPSGNARRAFASARIARSVADVWRVVEDVDRYPERVPMIHRVRLANNRATVDLKFKLALFSIGFQFVVDVLSEREKWIELRYVSGEPREIKLRFDLEPIDEKTTLLRSSGEFDLMSLGFLVKYFLKHHPEIQFGVMPGVAVALVESMRRAAER